MLKIGLRKNGCEGGKTVNGITAAAIRFPCHIYGMVDAKEAYDAWKGELVKDYGECIALTDGTVLHENCNWDEGGRTLVRCRECGALMILQSSVYNNMFDGPDSYYMDWIPVASAEEGDLLNILRGATELEDYPFRHFRGNNHQYFWTKGEEPRPYDPEDLKKKIRKRYAGLAAEKKWLLEDLISDAGKS